MTAAHCCLSPEIGTVTHGFYITIGAEQISSTQDVPLDFQLDGHTEFVSALTGEITIPGDYMNRVTNKIHAEWDICIIKLAAPLDTDIFVPASRCECTLK